MPKSWRSSTERPAQSTQYGGPAAMGGNSFFSYVYHSPWGFTSQGALYALTLQSYKHSHGFTNAKWARSRSRSAAGHH